MVSCKYAFEAVERMQHTWNIMMIITSKIIPNVEIYLGAVFPKAQTNPNRISQRKTSLKELPLKAKWLAQES